MPIVQKSVSRCEKSLLYDLLPYLPRTRKPRLSSTLRSNSTVPKWVVTRSDSKFSFAFS
ncbi:hypothetical protein [Nitrosomonas sp.]|uniref:hypothetical protein n=1 Tax=Nitrosomonas sp. TaxID=42353 RepID=UPI0035CD25AF